MDIISNVTANLDQLTLSSLSFTDAFTFLPPLAIFIGAILVYAVFVFNFYNFMSKKEIFKFEMTQAGSHLRKGFDVFSYILKHIVIFPVIVSFCFLVLVVFFSFLSKNQSVETILLIAMTLVATIRITSYFNEALSKELAKMIPIALLGVFLVDMGYFSLESSLATLAAVPTFVRTIVYYIGFVVGIEILLRCISLIPFGKKHNKS
ncbi:MAG: hypothetical protein PHC66_00630 [Candidatus Nanoarchaeia archaeon]|nr:hypothetical protein [Candidatus Nanoarchaeia archaeon]MDD5239551.1 hypothetical protein [Candidatus Nanoarchaeia archaeon]